MLAAPENLDFIQHVGSPAVKIYYDVSNSTDKGDDIYQEIRAKDAWLRARPQGRMDFKKVREAMNEIGYRGWIQIEAAAPKNLATDYRAHCEFLKTVFPVNA